MPPEPAREDDGATSWDQQPLLLPIEHMPDVGQFLPELATELATAQTTQDEEVEQKEKHLQHLKVGRPAAARATNMYAFDVTFQEELQRGKCGAVNSPANHLQSVELFLGREGAPQVCGGQRLLGQQGNLSGPGQSCGIQSSRKCKDDVAAFSHSADL